MSDGRRPKRVAELLRMHLTDALRSELGDPRLGSVVVTDVTVPDDLSFARISVRLLVGDDEPAQRRSAVYTLERAASRLRRSLGPRLGLRRIPELRFVYDDGHDKARRVEQLLDEIAREPSAKDD